MKNFLNHHDDSAFFSDFESAMDQSIHNIYGKFSNIHTLLSQTVRPESDNILDHISHKADLTFSHIERRLSHFTRTGNIDFSGMADSFVNDMLHNQIKNSITNPLSYIVHDLFSSRPQFHSGGVVGDDIPVTLKHGEAVFTFEQLKSLQAQPVTKGDSPITIHIHNNVPQASVHTTSEQGADGQQMLNIFLENIEHKLSNQISKGNILAQTLEQHYGLQSQNISSF